MSFTVDTRRETFQPVPACLGAGNSILPLAGVLFSWLRNIRPSLQPGQHGLLHTVQLNTSRSRPVVALTPLCRLVVCLLGLGLLEGGNATLVPAQQAEQNEPKATNDSQADHGGAAASDVDRSSSDSPPQPLDGNQGRELLLRNFFPEPELHVKSTNVQHAAFPVVDVHTHFFYRQRHNREALDDFVDLMDRNRIAICVSLDGKLGPQLEEHLAFLWKDYRDRFVVFANIDWQGEGTSDQPATWACNQPGFVRHTVESLRDAKEQGVSGIKIFKQFGLGYRDTAGELLRIDDRRWDPIWQVCGELGLPILIHTADPVAFFRPIDNRNERWEELSRHPDWSFVNDEPDDDFPTREALLEARNRVIERHPQTQFIGAHMANSSENLATVSRWLERYPNLWIDPASRISELGRQPYTARDFLIKHADRVLFGTDGPWPETRIRLYWRFFETRDEYFPYSEKPFPPQGFWQIYGVDLPDAVLQKIYYENAAKLIPGVAERLEEPLQAFRQDE